MYLNFPHKFSSLKSLMNITTPIIQRQRTRSATTNAGRVKTAVTRVGEYFAQISAKRLSVFTYNSSA